MSFARNFRRRFRRWGRENGIDVAGIGGIPISMESLSRHLLILGLTGMGKSFSTEGLMVELARRGHPMLVCMVKPDEAKRWMRIARHAGQTHRVVHVKPGSGRTLNIASYLLERGDKYRAMEVLEKLNAIALRSSGQGDDQFWVGLFRRCGLNALALAQMVSPEVSVADLVSITNSAPASRADAASESLLSPDGPSLCGRMLAHADTLAAGDPAMAAELRGVAQFYLNEFCAIGDRARGAAITNMNGTLGRLADGVIGRELNGRTTLTPRMIEDKKLLVLLDFSIMEHGESARLYLAAWTILCQLWCLGRDPSGIELPFVIVRDECHYLLHPEHDAKVQTVARSQKLLHIDITQGVSTLLTALGDRAKPEAASFVSNHGNVLFFGNTDDETNKLASAIVGERKELFFSGGGRGGGEDGNWLDRALGARAGTVHWSEQKQPWLAPGFFGSLERGVAVLHSAGTWFGSKPYELVDFRR